jgi:hypothetical protein
MLNISIDASRVEARLDNMLNQIAAFGQTTMPDELLKWQVDDVHRTFPNVDKPSPETAEMSMKTHGGHTRVESSRTGFLRAPRRPRTVLIRKPVIRPKLIEQLRARMAAQMQQELKWR